MKFLHKKIIFILVFFLGFLSHFLLSHFQNQKKEVFSHNNLLQTIWEKAEELYPFEEPTDAEKKYAAIQGLIYSYKDPYSTFYTPDQTKVLRENIGGEFAGAGMEIGIRNGFLTVISPLAKSPAYHAGFLPKDIIVEIDGEAIANKSMDQVISLIRGEKGTEVTFSVLRKGNRDLIELIVVRDIVKIPILENSLISDTFVISLFNFNDGSEKSFKDALLEFRKSGKKNLLIDLRNNPGGYLKSSIDIASYFLDQGEVILREDFGSLKEMKSYRSKGFDDMKDLDYKLGVLINQGSASASEIVAGALQDHKVALVLGVNSYGKGSVQQLVETDEDTALKITIAKWLTPEKKQISEIGISPDFPIDMELSEKEFLSRAVELLEKN